MEREMTLFVRGNGANGSRLVYWLESVPTSIAVLAIETVNFRHGIIVVNVQFMFIYNNNTMTKNDSTAVPTANMISFNINCISTSTNNISMSLHRRVIKTINPGCTRNLCRSLILPFPPCLQFKDKDLP